MRSKYCFRPEDLSSAVFWFDNAYLRTTTEPPEDLFTLYVMRIQKRKRRNLRGLQGCESWKKMIWKVSLKNQVATFFDTFLQDRGAHATLLMTEQKLLQLAKKTKRFFFRSTAFYLTRD